MWMLSALLHQEKSGQLKPLVQNAVEEKYLYDLYFQGEQFHFVLEWGEE